MYVLTHQKNLPRAFDTARADHAMDRMQDWPGDLRPLLHGVAGCSPYLAELMGHVGDWLIPALADPDAALEAELARVADLPPDQLRAGLRLGKRRVALMLGVLDLARAWDARQVTRALTRFADAACDAALRGALTPLLARGKIPGMQADDVATGCGMVVLAMGKMGAFELNYSSDIDLICLLDDTRFDPEDLMEARAALVRATRNMVALLSDMTGDGYVFRTDLRLRPDPSVTPVCVPMSGAESYYESLGRGWERAAYIKARPAAGDLAAGTRFLDGLRPFVWRKYLDFAAIQDTHDMRLKIRDHKGTGGALVLEGHNIKLGRGGIREIEFFAQTQQLVLGGRSPTLRHRRTEDALDALAQHGTLPQETAQRLQDHYWAHRSIEHRVQMVHDAQTHILPNTDEGFARLASMDDVSPADLRRDLCARIEEVHALTEAFFAPASVDTVSIPDFAEPIIDRWPSYPSMRSARAREIFARLRPDILRRLQDAADPEGALRQFDRFLAELPAGVQLFSLFEANPSLTQLMCEICAHAPALAEYLGNHVAVFDAVIGPDFFAPLPDFQTLLAELGARVAGHDYEAQLAHLRSATNEHRFRIGVHFLRGVCDADQAGRHYADLARAVVQVIWPCVCDHFAARHGAAPGRGAMVVAMGSLGAGRIHTLSDLDLIVLYDADGQERSEGPRPLETRPYYARLTQALITALKAPMAEGILYEADMRLRPSGRQGPVATSLAGFAQYQRDDAWTWEHLAQTRAQAIAGPPELCAQFEALRRDLIAQRGAGRDVVCDLAEMRARIFAAKDSASPWRAKIGPGRLQDIELFAQSLALRAGAAPRDVAGQIAAGHAAGLIDDQAAADLTQAADLFWRLQAIQRLISAGPFDPESSGAGPLAQVLRGVGAAHTQAALAQIDATATRAAQIIDAGGASLQ